MKDFVSDVRECVAELRYGGGLECDDGWRCWYCTPRALAAWAIYLALKIVRKA